MECLLDIITFQLRKDYKMRRLSLRDIRCLMINVMSKGKNY